MDTQWGELYVLVGQFRDQFLDENGWPDEIDDWKANELMKVIAKIQMALGDDIEFDDSTSIIAACERIRDWLTDEDGDPEGLAREMVFEAQIKENIDGIEEVLNSYSP